MDDCTCSVMLNNEFVEKQFKVPGENKGRTTSEWAINANLIKFNGENNEIVLNFDHGYGVLFMSWFEFWIETPPKSAAAEIDDHEVAQPQD